MTAEGPSTTCMKERAIENAGRGRQDVKKGFLLVFLPLRK